MFKRQNRLPRGVNFYNSKFFSTPLFVLKVKENGLTLNRFGIVVSKKIDKRAVARNKIKRMFRQIIQEFNSKMKIGHDMLFIVKSGIKNKTSNDTKLAIREILGKEKYIKEWKNFYS